MGACLSNANKNLQWKNDRYSQCSSKQSIMQNKENELAEGEWAIEKQTTKIIRKIPDGQFQSSKEERIMKIINLPNECLMKIFGYLDHKNLFNVAIANKRLKLAAAEVHKEQAKVIGIFLKTRDEETRLFDMQTQQNCATEYFRVWGCEMCLSYLRCFGSSTRNLAIDSGSIYHFSTSKRHKDVYQHINTYCVGTELKFFHLSKASMKQFVKPFINVHCVTVEDSDLEEDLSELTKWFPNLRHLKLNNVHSTDGFDRVHFPHLEQLSLCGILGGKYEEFCTNLLGSNRQLRSLDIQLRCMPINTLLDMIRNHPLITKLTVSRYICSPQVNSFEIERIANEHSALIELDFKDFCFTADGVIGLIDQLISLKTFSFRVKENSTSRNIGQLESNLDQNKWTLTKIDADYSYLKLDRKKQTKHE